MTRIEVDTERLERFERALDPADPEGSEIPARVLGYGEISTVLAIGDGEQACKRMPMFADQDEITAYSAALESYLACLQDAGIQVAPGVLVPVQARSGGRRVVYLVQPRLPSRQIGNSVVRTSDAATSVRLLRAVLRELGKLYRYNQQQAAASSGNGSRWTLGIDGQISNWAVTNPDALAGSNDAIELCYFDVNTPLVRRNGVEQLDTELFLRSAPAFLRWVLRLFVVQDVVDRYYDLRRVVVDLIANLYKEGRADLVPVWLEMANAFLGQELAQAGYARIDQREVDAYYREDVRIWRLYLGLRRFDRTLHRLTRRRYPYVLPGPIQR